MAKMLVDRPITEVEWDALVDPGGGRYEVLDGRLAVRPSFNANTSRYCEDLTHMLRSALHDAGLDLPVTRDVEWRTIANGLVDQAPRGDVLIGLSLDPERRIHDAVPLLVAEVWSPITAADVRNERRAYWASVGVRNYWDLCSAKPTTRQRWRFGISALKSNSPRLESLALRR